MPRSSARSLSLCLALSATLLEGASSAQGAPAQATVAAPAATPEDIVRRYLERGAAGDLAAVRALVEPGCEDSAVGRAEGVTVMGVRMTLRAVRTAVIASSATEVRVRYTVTGSAQGSNATARILGATVRIGRVRAANVTQSSVLRLVRARGRWVIACR